MRGNKIMGFIWVIIAVVLTLLFGVVLKNNGFSGIPKISIGSNSSSSKELSLKEASNHQNFEVSSICNIKLALVSEAIRIEKNSGSKLEVELFGAEAYLPTVSLKGNTLEIEQKHKGIKFMDFSKRTVVVKIPDGKEFEKVDLNSVSGSIKIQGLNCRTCDINAVSGSVNVSDSNINKLDLNAVSGSVKLDEVECENLDVNTVSGSIKLCGNFGKFDVNSTSGSISVDSDGNLEWNSSVNSVSGSIKVNIPSSTNANIIYKTRSGSYSNGITGTSGKKGEECLNGGGCKLEVTSSSGSIRIN